MQNDDCGDMVEIETRCIIPIWRTFGRIPWPVIPPEPPATLQGGVTWRNQCHDRATLQGVTISSAILKIVFYFILFFNAVWALTSGGFRIVSDTLLISITNTDYPVVESRVRTRDNRTGHVVCK